jgi:hypothetical protein
MNVHGAGSIGLSGKSKTRVKMLFLRGCEAAIGGKDT